MQAESLRPPCWTIERLNMLSQRHPIFRMAEIALYLGEGCSRINLPVLQSGFRVRKAPLSPEGGTRRRFSELRTKHFIVRPPCVANRPQRRWLLCRSRLERNLKGKPSFVLRRQSCPIHSLTHSHTFPHSLQTSGSDFGVYPTCSAMADAKPSIPQGLLGNG